MEEQKVYRIPMQNMEKLESKIAHLNRRAEKVGCSPVQLVKGEVEVVPKMAFVGFTVEDGVAEWVPTGEVHVYQVVWLEGVSIVKFNGWRLLGKIDATDAGNILNAVPGEAIPEEYREVKPTCEHCKARRFRRDVFIVGHDDGSSKMVGRNCLRDFLGHGSPDNWVRHAQFLDLVEKSIYEYLGVGGVKAYIDKEMFVTWVVGSVRRFGWVGRAKAEEIGRMATADSAYSHMFPCTKFEPDFHIDQGDKDRAAIILQWASGLKEREGLTDFMKNLAVVSQLPAFTEKQIGIAAAMVVAYDREMELLEERRKQKAENDQAAASSLWQGEIGKRSNFTLTVNKIITVQGYDYGFFIYKMTDDKGNIFVWKTSNPAGSWSAAPHITWQEVKEGMTYQIKATVKAHTEYKGVKQTEVQRCKFNF